VVSGTTRTQNAAKTQVVGKLMVPYTYESYVRHCTRLIANLLLLEDLKDLRKSGLLDEELLGWLEIESESLIEIIYAEQDQGYIEVIN
jgi:hypothetical protein